MKNPKQSYTQIVLWLFSIFSFLTTGPWSIKRTMAFENSNGVSNSVIGSAVPFFWPIAIVGGSIILTLLYVGWKKYKADRRKQKRKKE